MGSDEKGIYYVDTNGIKQYAETTFNNWLLDTVLVNSDSTIFIKGCGNTTITELGTAGLPFIILDPAKYIADSVRKNVIDSFSPLLHSKHSCFIDTRFSVSHGKELEFKREEQNTWLDTILPTIRDTQPYETVVMGREQKIVYFIPLGHYRSINLSDSPIPTYIDTLGIKHLFLVDTTGYAITHPPYIIKKVKQ